MKKFMKRQTSPEQILRNLRSTIDEAEEILSLGRGSFDEEQFSEFQRRIEAGFNRLRDASGGLGSRVHGYYDEAEERLRDYYEEVEDRLRSSLETTRRTVSSHPYKMAAVTLGLGAILIALMRTGRSD